MLPHPLTDTVIRVRALVVAGDALYARVLQGQGGEEGGGVRVWQGLRYRCQYDAPEAPDRALPDPRQAVKPGCYGPQGGHCMWRVHFFWSVAHISRNTCYGPFTDLPMNREIP